MQLLKTFKSKKPTLKELADYLGVSESAVKHYKKDKKHLMVLGLWVLKEDKLLSKKN